MTDSPTRTPAAQQRAASADFGAELRLPRPPGVFRRWLAGHPRAVDWIIVGTYLFGCAMMLAFEVISGYVARTFPEDLDPEAAASMNQFSSTLGWGWSLVRLLIVATTAAALATRRRFPVAGVIVVSLLMVFEQGMLVAPNSIAVVFLLYAVPVFRGVRLGWIAFGCAAVLHTLPLLFSGSGGGLIGPAGFMVAGDLDLRSGIVLAVLNVLWLLAVLMIGINLGNRRRYVEALIDRAHQLAREREQKAQLAAAAERGRIAREMHDIVAHSLSVVVTLSEAASVSVESQPQAAKRAMERAAETGRSALVEMRRLLGVLNTEEGGETEAPRAPQPGASQLQGLIEGFRQAGLRIAATEQGVPAGDAAQQLAVYRIVQEGLTNSLRYAGRGAEVRLTLEHSPGGTRIEVVDSRVPPGAPGAVASDAEDEGGDGGGASEGPGEDRAVAGTAIPGSGRGLAGARERARMFGGSLDAGPHGTGWRLSANVPIQGEER